MSSPSVSPAISSSSSHRNPRRRQRKDSEEGASLRLQPQRKRSKLGDGAFNSFNDLEVNGSLEKKPMNGHILNGYSGQKSSPQTINIPVRGKAHSSRRATKEDGSTILTQNPNYAVKQLPSIPEQFRTDHSGLFRGTLSSENGLALALTNEHALVWDYNSSTTAPKARVFGLSQLSEHGTALPLGALVTGVSSTETGLVVVGPNSGKILFWENIEDADALSLFANRKNGLQGSVGKMLSGETVTAIEKADLAGYVLLFSSGRTAQLLLRDLQSKAVVTVRFLRAKRDIDSGGFFGSLKNVFGASGWLKEVVAVKSRPSPGTRGLDDVVIVNDKAIFQIWQLSWSSQALFVGEVDARSVIEEAVSEKLEADLQDRLQDTHILDIALASHPAQHSSDEFDLVVLLKVDGASSSTNAIVEVDLKDNLATVRRIVCLRSYTTPLITRSEWKPQLCLPQPYHTAFAIFESAVVLISLATFSSVESQLLMECNSMPEPFQDTIYFREEKDALILGAEAESSPDKSRQSEIVLFVRNYGLVRISAFEPDNNRHPMDRARINAKSRIEQAIFYGTIPGNPLSLAKALKYDYAIEEVEAAAIEISEEVLSSKSSFTSTVSVSMASHLEHRAQALRNLALHLKHAYPVISREGRWKLRWDAEKIAAAQKIWSSYDGQPQREFEEVRLLSELINYVPDKYKTLPKEQSGELDHVRHWFLRDVGTIQNIIPWAFQAVYELCRHDGVKDSKTRLRMFSEADDVVLDGLETAFTFRTENAWLYNLEDEPMKDGILQSHYEGLPRFWTSTAETIFKIKHLIDYAREYIRDKLDRADMEEQFPTRTMLKIAADNPRLVDLCCRVYEECCRWYLGQPDQKTCAEGQTLQQQYLRARREMIKYLADIKQVEMGMALAEKYEDMPALVSLVKGRSAHLMRKLASPALEVEDVKDVQLQIKAMEARVREYFKRFGTDWADTFYSSYISGGRPSVLLDQASSYQDEVTQFLRNKPTRKKLSWINDVLREKDLGAAGKSLVDVATSQEQNTWCKKVELSLARLALIAAKGGSHDVEMNNYETMQRDAMALLKIEERLYAHIKPSLYDAMDKVAELQLAMEAFGRFQTEQKPALQQLLERGMESLLSHLTMDTDQLIDILTLMDQRTCEITSDDIAGQEFVLAFQALSYAGVDKGTERYQLLLRTIWRRCFIRDNWEEINNTLSKSDNSVMERLAATTLFKTYYEGNKAALWEGELSVPRLEPTDVVGVGVTPDEHKGRFHLADLRLPIARDNLKEDELLQQYIQHARLDHWIVSTRKWADHCLAAEVTATMEDQRKQQQVVKELRKEFSDLATGRAEMSLPRAWDETDDK